MCSAFNLRFLALLVLLSILFAVPTLGSPDKAQAIDHDSPVLLRIAHISDTHIVDDESPARLVLGEWLTKSAWRPQETYSVQTLDATLQAINEIHKTRPIDFVIQTGDAIDSAQYNELRWFIDTMDGNRVTPDSGALDGRFRNVPDRINSKLPYHAQGLLPDIRWYSVYGNHDALAVGIFSIHFTGVAPVDRYAEMPFLVRVFFGYSDIDLTQMIPTSRFSPALIRGDIDYGRDPGRGLDRNLVPAGMTQSDPDRRFVSRKEFIAEHFNTTGFPVGHGFETYNLDRGVAYYSRRPVSNIPVRLIVIDTADSDAPPQEMAKDGYFPWAQAARFLIPELERARTANEWVIIASHHPSSDFITDRNGVSPSEFRRILTGYPHVIAHLTGHSHRHQVTEMKGKYSYTEIQTGSIMDFPQEGRLIEIRMNFKLGRPILNLSFFRHNPNRSPFAQESLRRATAHYRRHH